MRRAVHDAQEKAGGSVDCSKSVMFVMQLPTCRTGDTSFCFIFEDKMSFAEFPHYLAEMDTGEFPSSFVSACGDCGQRSPGPPAPPVCTLDGLCCTFPGACGSLFSVV